MTQWYVKELSKLTQVSVQTLHHYDRIGLLEPSVRLANGYRLYSEKDLLKLQQILALKFFGFTLTQIKTLLSTDVKVLDQFEVQSKLLEEKAQMMFAASEALKMIIAECGDNKSIPWVTIIKLMEVYRMTQQLEQTWAGKVLSQDELTQYARFEHGLTTRFTPNEKQALGFEWDEIVNQVNVNLHQDPTCDIGIVVGKRCMDWVNR
ncbi:MAG: MerR family transcriptional regulator, partial [Pseudomonadota bacterium]|nr:MerR family transcriptional regulator [Pseudomonadota bacterium]